MLAFPARLTRTRALPSEEVHLRQRKLATMPNFLYSPGLPLYAHVWKLDKPCSPKGRPLFDTFEPHAEHEYTLPLSKVKFLGSGLPTLENGLPLTRWHPSGPRRSAGGSLHFAQGARLAAASLEVFYRGRMGRLVFALGSPRCRWIRSARCGGFRQLQCKN